ncbi:DUF5825 family protein [Streptomyces sp. NBC_01384]|uniref:DUF5825 family protein n=1 Tax=Streptomyces sp. NBC_01384 TaxID=2903847 RepID=UPI003243C6D9
MGRSNRSDSWHKAECLLALETPSPAWTEASPHTGVPADVLAEHLVLRVGELDWWLPYRVTRWLQEAMAV